MKKKRKQESLMVWTSMFYCLIIFVSCNQKDVDIRTNIDFYKNGNIKYIKQITDNNLQNGKTYIFNSDGEKYSETEYKNGLKDGKKFIFYKGSIISEENYIKDKLDGSVKYYENGYLSTEGNYNQGIKSGVWNLYDKYKLILSLSYNKVSEVDTLYKDDKYSSFFKNAQIEKID